MHSPSCSSPKADHTKKQTEGAPMIEFSSLCNEEVLFHILSFADEETRESFVFVSLAHSKILTSEASYLWRCQRLHLERGIYVSSYISPQDTWKRVFYRNYSSRRKNLWINDSVCRREDEAAAASLKPSCRSSYVNCSTGNTKDQFKLTVSARFKPRNLIVVESEENSQFRKNIALPLHQRLALIRMNRNITRHKEAFQVLMSQGGWFQNQSGGGDDDDAEHKEQDCESQGDRQEQSQNVIRHSVTGGVHVIDTVHNAVILVDRTKGLRRFEFDRVFCDQSTQEMIYKQTVMPLVADFINGYNATCLVYGQTGSGKTYSMFGPHVHDDINFAALMMSKDGNEQVKIPENLGIVPRAIKEIFDAVKYRNSHLCIKIHAKVSLSYIEIYGDEISDLFRNGATCGQSRVAAQRYVLDGSSEVIVPTLQEALALLDRGEKQKRKAATALNARSSRAHTLFIVTLQQECIESGRTATSRLFLVDLGGSEQIKKSQPYNAQGNKILEKQRIQEAININLGLLALKQCVQALVQKRKHVPYGDSKLTMMLSSGLGGDCKTSLIVCGAQEEQHGPETISSMNFGQTCRGISNSVKSNVNMFQNILRCLEEKIFTCEKKIREHEVWNEIDNEIFDDEGNLIEVRKKTIVTGADVFRRELTGLLRQKAELTGEMMDDQLYSSSLDGIEGFGNFHQYTSEYGGV